MQNSSLLINLTFFHLSWYSRPPFDWLGEGQTNLLKKAECVYLTWGVIIYGSRSEIHFIVLGINNIKCRDEEVKREITLCNFAAEHKELTKAFSFLFALILSYSPLRDILCFICNAIRKYLIIVENPLSFLLRSK